MDISFTVVLAVNSWLWATWPQAVSYQHNSTKNVKANCSNSIVSKSKGLLCVASLQQKTKNSRTDFSLEIAVFFLTLDVIFTRSLFFTFFLSSALIAQTRRNLLVCWPIPVVKPNSSSPEDSTHQALIAWALYSDDRVAHKPQAALSFPGGPPQAASCSSLIQAASFTVFRQM